MKDLFRCLDEYPAPLLEAIAGVWQVPLVRRLPRQMVLDLGEAMVQPEAAEPAIASLSPEAREGLDTVLHAGGLVPAHRLAAKHGSLRRFGPAKLEREQPWTSPANAAEELYYKGLLYRAYDSVGDFMGEVLLVPEPLRQALLAWHATCIGNALAEMDEPTHSASDGPAMAEDLLALLVHVRRNRPHPPAAALNLGPRCVGETCPERLALLDSLLRRLGLVEEARGRLRASRRAREWLQLPDDRRAWTIYAAWRDDPLWDELHYMPALRCEQESCLHNPALARRNLAHELGRCPPHVWLSLEAFLGHLKRYRPDFLRVDGDYAGWRVRDAHTNEDLSGFEAWERVEGALASHVVTQSLRWLGLVDVGYTSGREHAYAFRVNALGARMLGQDTLLTKGDESASSARLAVVDESFAVRIPLEDTLYERYQLERFAEWQDQDRVATYRITGESVWDSQNAGVKVEQILAFLNRVSGGQVPATVVSTLQAWGSRFGGVALRRQVLLEAADEKTMQQIASRPDMRGLLGRPISATMCLVAEEDVGELTRKLKALGIWPHLKR
ncbi:MAG: helicase-associated domain-containing protein [Anaerolineae bacterium]